MDRSQLAAIWLEKGGNGPYRILGKDEDGRPAELPAGAVEAARLARAAGDASAELTKFFECVPDELVPNESRVLFVPDVREPAGFSVLVETRNPGDSAAALDIKRRVEAALKQTAEDRRKRLGAAGDSAGAAAG